MSHSNQLPLIETNRCNLRLPEPSEAGIMCDFVTQNRGHLQPWEPVQPDNYYMEDYWKEKIIQIRANFLADKSCCFNVYRKEDGQLIGMVNYSNFIRGCFHSCFLGFKISEAIQGKGMMTEALEASIAYVFQTLNIHRIAANYMPDNLASARVLEKCWFVQEGVAEDYLYINGKWERHVLTSLINQSWESKND
jgi:[ribosomal protein S5]-alanine N-acetyltransferase